MTEQDVLRAIQLAATQRGHRLFRNNVGVGWVGQVIRHTGDTILLRNPRPLHAGLMEGSSDLIGLTNTGRFLAVEVKSERGRLTDDQRAWIAVIRRFGGLAGEARSIEDFEAILASGHNP